MTSFKFAFGNKKGLVVVIIALLIALIAYDRRFDSGSSAREVQTRAAPTPMPSPTAVSQITFAEESWLRLPEMAADATQAEIGSEIYRLVCSTCHGGQGQGLTSEWLTTFSEETRNCWQSKCHASNYPDDGFLLPAVVPPLVSPAIAARFRTAYDLFAFISTNMPYQAPGSLTESEYWQLTAHILDLNSFALGTVVLDTESSAAVKLE